VRRTYKVYPLEEASIPPQGVGHCEFDLHPETGLPTGTGVMIIKDAQGVEINRIRVKLELE
jgi:hypothetical protein